MPSQAGEGEAQIRATVTAKSRRGQVRKHYIWYGLLLDPVRLNTQCSTRLEIEWEEDEGGENRESTISLAQVAGNDNGEISFVAPASRRLGHLALGAEEILSCAKTTRARGPRHTCRAALGLDGRGRPPPHSSCCYSPSFSKKRQIDSMPR